ELFDISFVTNDNISLLKNDADNKNIKIISEIKLNTKVYADRNMTGSILRNLILNAIKFTHKGGDIKILSEDKEDFIEISVIDTGIGISEDNIKKLFRLDSDFIISGTSNERGTGLGLILCKEFVNKNGGDISVESKEGKGSSFKFTLPKMN
ncbi:MAG: HAMP domain-containing histidine kinase, partial [Bacteroidales bacterium]|nr:HAMP domain-containing histidine kinase [Bacteroidales bacterium]